MPVKTTTERMEMHKRVMTVVARLEPCSRNTIAHELKLNLASPTLTDSIQYLINNQHITEDRKGAALLYSIKG